MAFRFCTGPSGAGKSRFLHRYLLQKAQIDLEDPSGLNRNYIIIVPEQYSMLTQKELVMESPNKGILNIDVQSFGRLSYRIFQEVGVPERAVLDDIGKTLLLRRVAGKCAKDLKVFSAMVHRPGMIAEIKSILSEFMQYGVDPGALERMSEMAGAKGQGALSVRLLDLRILFDAFLQGERDRFVTTEERLSLLAEAVPYSACLRDSVIVLDGFTGFTPVQYSVILALIRAAGEVIISLPMGEDGGPSAAWTAANADPGREDALFYLSRKTISDLMRLAAGAGLRHGKDIVLDGEEGVLPRFKTSPVLAHLEKNLFRHPAPAYCGDTGGSIRIIETDTVEEEVRQVCIMIRRLVLEQGYEFRQIAVICGDLPAYGELFEKIAVRYDIPLYVDKTGTSALNPLTEAIRAVLQIKPQSYSYKAVFRYLRSGMSSLTSDETDLLENYCLAHGIRGRKKWEMPFDADTEPLRQRFLEEIRPVMESGRTALERTAALYTFMTGCDMQEKMQAYAEAFGKEGDHVRQKQFDQLYARVIDLLEQMADLLGEEEITDRDYAEILDAGFSEIRLGTLPQQVDRVLVGDIERTRLPQGKVLFLTGVNDGNIPAGAVKGGILSELDREFLREAGAELAPTPRQQMYLQRLYLYLNMTKPTDSLFLSMARIGRDSSSLQPSYLIAALKDLFPSLSSEHPQTDPPASQITGRRDALPLMADALRDYAEGLLKQDPAGEAALCTMYGYLRRTAAPEEAKEMEQLTEAAFMRYDPELISPETVRRLYGSHLHGSITRLETMTQCPMRQFLTYGLGLKERSEYRIEPADTGSILHEALDRFENKMRSRGLTWTSFTQDESAEMIREALEETAASYHDLILYDTARSRVRKGRLEKTLNAAVTAIRYQLDKGDFVPVFHEFMFGPGRDAGPLTYDLGEGRKLSIAGRVDRVDLMESPGCKYVKVLDYKLGMRDLSVEKMKSGMQLQLMIYMQAVMEYLRQTGQEAEVLPAAMLYLQLNEPTLTQKDIGKDEDWGIGEEADDSVKQKVQRSLNGAMRPTGLVCSEEDVIRHLDRTITAKSDVIPVTLGRNGQVDTRSKHTYTLQEFEELYSGISETICSLAGDILGGRAEASPLLLDKNTTACTWCPFREVCVFDPAISGFSYRDSKQ